MSVTDMWDTARKGFKFAERGDKIEGQIVAVEVKQLATFENPDTLETWSNGDPKLTPIITVQTELQDADEDDGMRSLYLRSGLYTAFQAALKDAYQTKPSDEDLKGATIKVQFYKTAPASNPRFNDRKVYRALITPKASVAEAAWDEEPPPHEPRAEDADEDEVPF